MPLPAIKRLASSDHADWLALWRAYQAFYEVEIAPAVSAITWERLHDPHEPMHGAIASLEGRAAGLVHWITHRSTWTTGDYCYLQDLFVAPSARGSGLGEALIAHVETEARQAGCARLYWLTHESNTTAMRLYDRVAQRSGFVQYRKMLDP